MGGEKMKVVKDLNIGGVHPNAGCVCSSGRNNAKGPFWDPIWNCNCQCDYGDENYNANHSKAKKA